MSVSPAATNDGRLRAPVRAGLLGKAAEAVTLLLLAVVVPRTLGPADYGRFSVALTVVAVGSVAMTLGGATLLARYVPAAAAPERPALARALTLRLARHRAWAWAALAVVAAALAVADPATFPPLVTAFVLLALALNVAATLALQADLGLGRTGPWCARYPVQNAALVVAVIVLHDAAGSTGAAGAILVAAVVGAGLAAVASRPLLTARRHPVVAWPEGAPRFGLLQAGSGVLVQLTQRGGIVVVAVVGGAGAQTGFAALALGVALAATYAVVQVFTVSLPTLARRDDDTLDAAEEAEGAEGAEGAEAALRRLAGRLLVVVLAGAAVAAPLLDVVTPAVFGAGFAAASAAFVPALALVVLAPVNALAVQAAALRLRPRATLQTALGGFVVFGAAAALAVPAWGAAGATSAALLGAAGSVAVALRVLPGAVGTRLAVASPAGAAAVVALGVLT
ncbi:oligosaccharide flippase family protein [Actinomycetospora cinnamomea]|uniref:O-antigen/teichoic acid export membrane protein n=1 Tax=Actinomycetospora cinnamomea TaxID=663609 RepID=A0A2U1EWD5_9PSEU|nr:oligosaccharide flippase family protein [Actinomycetospora cinnamomea]PVZ04244.1 O-antigen/teichoic acid export membrane protein [Actinomycetospora cinnamomea]